MSCVKDGLRSSFFKLNGKNRIERNNRRHAMRVTAANGIHILIQTMGFHFDGDFIVCQRLKKVRHRILRLPAQFLSKRQFCCASN